MTQNISVFQLAKEFDIKALELIEKIKPLDLKIKNHMAELSPEQADQIRAFLNPPKAEAPKKKTVVRSKAKEKDAPKADAPAKPSVVITRTRAAAPQAEAEAPASTVIRRKSGAVDAPSASVEAPEAEVTAAPEAVAQELAPESQFDEAASPEASAPDEAPVQSSMETASEPEAAPVEEIAAVAPPEVKEVSAAAATGGVVRRTSRFSVIRVVSPEPAVRARPLIVEEAPAGAEKTYGVRKGPSDKTNVPKTFSDPELARTGSTLIRQQEDEETRKKKAAAGVRRDDDQVFKSTDYLRRERVYQPKKKKLSIGFAQKKASSTRAADHKRVVFFEDEISVADLADQMSVKVYDVMKKLRGLGVEQPDDAEGFDDWYIDLATAQLLAAEYQFELRDETFSEEAAIESAVGGDSANQEPRSAVVTIMGHVDHGKTSLLDIIRRARVVEGEAGGITQHIGAYTVRVADAVKNLSAKKDGGGSKKDKAAAKAKAGKGAKVASGPVADSLTFLDTPGHAAFTSMRARGASVTDIVILVVSATDGVMPQTREAVDHAKAAGVPLIVAVNKMDLPDANPDRIRQQLSELGLVSEEWGGDTIFVPLSAKTGDGVDKLLEMIQIQAELLELKARATGLAEGTIIEAKLDKGRGPVATVLIKAGLLSVGDYVVAGTQTGKVRALIDDKGVNVKQAGPSTPVEILGLGAVPEAGDILTAISDEKMAKQLVEHRIEQKKAEAGGASLEDLYARMSASDLKELPLIIKTDVKGSAEAIQFALQKLPQNKVRLKILSAAVGGISESDVLLASASKAVVVGFNVRPDSKSQNEAERRGVQIKTYTIIYDLIDDVTKAMEGLLAPTYKETVMGRAEVRNVFTITKVGAVAGCSVTKGKIQRSNSVRLIRDNRVIYTGKLSGLKRFKDDAREVAEGFECGISIENYNDIKTGDVIEAFTTEAIAGSLNEGPGASA
ncbi:MAG: translation initiation factor IF-2 [Bdellovibrionales bacterium]|nr:translation initiation factor IF-2 [Bdellovibrionales bacterium]